MQKSEVASTCMDRSLALRMSNAYILAQAQDLKVLQLEVNFHIRAINAHQGKWIECDSQIYAQSFNRLF